MVHAAEQRLARSLASRSERGLLRALSHADGMVDFSSNDYLGLSRAPELLTLVDNARQALTELGGPSQPQMAFGSTGSRLLTGNSHTAEALEKFLAEFHDAPAALLFNSGYDANVGFFSCVPQPGDIVLYDELVHASVHDGMRLGRAPRTPFRHNDAAHARALLLEHRTRHAGAPEPSIAFVVVESVYSMDGDEAPLAALADVCDELGACLVVDEAHATGVVGAHGAGCVQQQGLQRRVFARLHTFGKGLGCHGAAVVGSVALRQYLINYARSLIYTTSLPPHSLIAIRMAYDVMVRADERRAHLAHLVDLFRKLLRALPAPASLLPSTSAIQGVVVPGNDAVVRLAAALRAAQFDVKPIRSPTVPAGTERVRICLHAHNSEDEVRRLCEHVARYFGTASAKL